MLQNQWIFFALFEISHIKILFNRGNQILIQKNIFQIEMKYEQIYKKICVFNRFFGLSERYCGIGRHLVYYCILSLDQVVCRAVRFWCILLSVLYCILCIGCANRIENANYVVWVWRFPLSNCECCKVNNSIYLFVLPLIRMFCEDNACNLVDLLVLYTT